MPTDAPILLTPIYHELDRVKDSLPNAQKFMKQKQLDWWTNFFIEKEDEGRCDTDFLYFQSEK